MKKYKIAPKKVFDPNPVVAIRNLTMLIEATGIVYLENNPHIDRIKHMVTEVEEIEEKDTKDTK